MLDNWRTFASYCVVGAGSVAVQFGTLVFFINTLQLNHILSSAVGFVVACLFQYILLYYWTFRSHGTHRTAVFRYIVVVLSTLMVNVLFFWILHEFMKLHYVLSQGIAASGVCLINYFFNKHFTFSSI